MIIVEHSRLGYLEITHDLINENPAMAASLLTGCLVLGITTEKHRISKYLITSKALPEIQAGELIPVYSVNGQWVTSEDGPTELMHVDLTSPDGTKYRTWTK